MTAPTRLILAVVILFVAFTLLAHLLPAELLVPLYCLFVAGGVGYVFWERQRLGRRREALERELEESESEYRDRLRDLNE
ncbi:MAG: hypothetical protein R3272_08750 [Candidatus Promineifilaceae bacterium]|nr:hypothetical protein [Candidatus Promineifilaceae bacterium]